ncbi:Drosophila melanogaster AT13596p [Plasmodium yoelii yoelii]|uniref:Drosophila melanogaster AT13596p n=1 Tax=Plasmodium yoelii yoelii TaxID=73239 RepID=Q7RA22_PLAYO|nr:Drosophila melanogaster AT13596p [Plasmodium yoelii yoelii]
MINEQNNNINNLSLGKCISTQKKYIYKFEKFSVFSFNILANSLVDYKYNNNCASVMKWMNRKKLIYKNITNKLSDIICLQEIEKLYFIELQEKLKLLNYKGIFLKKNKETCKDGICIFYNTKVFELLFVDKVIYDKSIFFKKWHAGLIVALRNLKSKKIEYYDSNKNGCNEQINDNLKKNNNNFVNDAHDIIIVSNTHLIFDSRHGDIKLYQLCYLTYRLVFMINKCIKYIKESVKQEKGDKGLIDSSEENTEEHEKDELNDILKPAIIFCGDFNLTPNSLLYYYITNRYINLKNVNLKNISGQYLMFKKQVIYLQFFKWYENILNSEYLINSFSKKKNNLKNFDSFEYTFKKLKNKSSEETYEDVNSEKADSKINESICVSKQEDSVSKFNEIFDSVDTDEKEKNKPINYKTYKYNEKTIKENEKPNVEMHENTKMMDNDDQNFILYYPLYLESIYNGCAQNNVEEKCYKYDDIENLNNSSTHLMIRNVPFTVFHGKQKGCVDYIFYSYKNLKKLSYTNLPSFEQLEKYGCLPNKKYASSDHLYLHATLIRKIED